jgi:hypothetical protein
MAGKAKASIAANALNMNSLLMVYVDLNLNIFPVTSG